MEQKYLAFATRLRARMEAIGIPTNRELRARLAKVKAEAGVGENMVSRWMMGQSRPWGQRLEALLDVLGVMEEADRNEWKAAAYGPPDTANRPDEDDVPSEHGSAA